METKTIRFEKNELYSSEDMTHIPLVSVVSSFSYEKDNYHFPYRAFKSFTVTITITEDGE